MSIPKLYRIWRKKLKELMVDHRYEEARLRNTTHLVVGMYRKQSVHLNEIACKIPDPIQKLSITRRMRRLLAGEAIDARTWYEPIAKQVLQAASVSGEVRLIVDTTKVTAHKRLLMVAVLPRNRGHNSHVEAEEVRMRPKMSLNVDKKEENGAFATASFRAGGKVKQACP